MKIGVFLPNWIGDAVMATPALRALRTQFLSAEIVGICRPYVADVLAGLDSLDRVMYYNPRGNDRNLQGWRMARTLFREHFDTLVLLPNSMRSALMASVSRAPTRVGFARDGRTLLLTHPVRPKPKSEPNPVLDEYLRLTEQLGCRPLSKQTELAVLPEDREQLSQFWATQSASMRERPLVCLNPGGAFGAAKHWPAEHFAALASRFADELGKSVLVLCGPAEQEIARQIVNETRHEFVTSLAEFPPSIGLTKACVESAELLVTTDSGPRHFAQPFDVPAVTLFGPTHIAWSETYAPKAIHLQLEMDCGPCQKRVCPLKHHRCMNELTPDAVFRASCQLLDQQSSRRRAA